MGGAATLKACSGHRFDRHTANELLDLLDLKKPCKKSRSGECTSGGPNCKGGKFHCVLRTCEGKRTGGTFTKRHTLVRHMTTMFKVCSRCKRQRPRCPGDETVLTTLNKCQYCHKTRKVVLVANTDVFGAETFEMLGPVARKKILANPLYLGLHHGQAVQVGVTSHSHNDDDMTSSDDDEDAHSSSTDDGDDADTGLEVTTSDDDAHSSFSDDEDHIDAGLDVTSSDEDEEIGEDDTGDDAAMDAEGEAVDTNDDLDDSVTAFGGDDDGLGWGEADVTMVDSPEIQIIDVAVDWKKALHRGLTTLSDDSDADPVSDMDFDTDVEG